MSRSYKKHPVVTCAKNKKGKKEANKKVRKTDDIGNNSNYKKCFNSWDICDYKEWIVNKISEWQKKMLRK